MNPENDKHETYYIPPNFIEGSTLFGGMFKIRNAVEAGIIAALIGIPVLSLNFSLTVRIIILCLTALPLAMLALIGFSEECLSSFLLGIFKFLKNRRVISAEQDSRKTKTPESPYLNLVAAYCRVFVKIPAGAMPSA